VNAVNSRPYAWPYHGTIEPERTAVLVCTDAAVAAGDAAVARLGACLERLRRVGLRVVHLPRRDCRPVLPPQPGDLVVERSAYGGFSGSDLDLVLRNAGLTDLLFAGFPAELGADCTMREANDLGYECLLIEDWCSGLSQETFAGAVSSVQMSGGIFGAVAGARDVLRALDLD
jgi:hypothetical protein